MGIEKLESFILPTNCSDTDLVKIEFTFSVDGTDYYVSDILSIAKMKKVNELQTAKYFGVKK